MCRKVLTVDLAHFALLLPLILWYRSLTDLITTPFTGASDV